MSALADDRALTLADHTHLLRLYTLMLRIRVVEERIAELYAEQEMRCPVHLSIGQEAVEAAACAALEPRDFVMSGHRSHGHYLAKGGNLKAMMAEIYGRATGCAGGKGGSMHLVDLSVGFLGATPIVGATIPIAVGSAFASAMYGDDSVTMIFLGDGATETGVFHESINFAVLKRLPVVFVCENNLYSVYSPMEVRQPARSIAGLAAGHGLAVASGDGNDVEAAYGLTRTAVDRARDGGGPSFLEFATYRWLEHCGPNYDNDIGYRTEAEFFAWRAGDPLTRLEQRLLDLGAATPRDLHAARASQLDEMNAAVDFAKASPFPDAVMMGADIYAERGGQT